MQTGMKIVWDNVDWTNERMNEWISLGMRIWLPSQILQGRMTSYGLKQLASNNIA